LHSEFNRRLLVDTVTIVKVDMLDSETLKRLLDGYFDLKVGLRSQRMSQSQFVH